MASRRPRQLETMTRHRPRRLTKGWYSQKGLILSQLPPFLVIPAQALVRVAFTQDLDSCLFAPHAVVPAHAGIQSGKRAGQLGSEPSGGNPARSERASDAWTVSEQGLAGTLGPRVPGDDVGM